MENPFEIIHEELKSIREELIEIKERQLGQSKIEILDTDQLAERLNVARQTIGNWRKHKRIPFIQEGSVIRYNFPKVVEALESINYKFKQ